jgi:hypothetical protein
MNPGDMKKKFKVTSNPATWSKCLGAVTVGTGNSFRYDIYRMIRRT